MRIGVFQLRTKFLGDHFSYRAVGANGVPANSRDLDWWEYNTATPLPDNSNGAGDCNLKITWQAHYPTARDIKGNLKLKLTVITAKGTINHTLFIEVKSAGGTSVSLGKPKLVDK